MKANKIIIAPLNWGLGHATRCIPIINRLITLGYAPVLASDGQALTLLQKEFPDLEVLQLSSYQIKYKKPFILGVVTAIPHIINGVIKENRILKGYIQENKFEIAGIISDNRLGIYHTEIKSVYITHQLNIQAGIFSGFVNYIHHYFIKKHQCCWVPDQENSIYSGVLSKHKNIKASYIGVLSRFRFKPATPKYDLLILLSGIAKQRNDFEKIIKEQIHHYKGKVLLVRGDIKNKSIYNYPDNVEVKDYLLTNELEKTILASKLVLCRSGYSTIMDLTALNKPAFLIPTPGQTEQEYLAKYLNGKGWFKTCSQFFFNVKMLEAFKIGNRMAIDKGLLAKQLDVFLKYKS